MDVAIRIMQEQLSMDGETRPHGWVNAVVLILCGSDRRVVFCHRGNPNRHLSNLNL